jgi:hypothetical protein
VYFHHARYVQLTCHQQTVYHNMVFSANNQQNDLIFDFNSTLIQTVNTHKHLGVIFSCDCKWTKHINTIIERFIIFFSVFSSCAVSPIDVSPANSLPRPSMSSAISFINIEITRDPILTPGAHQP